MKVRAAAGRSLIASALLSLLPAPALADTLVDHVFGQTPDKDGTGIETFTGLVIDPEGRIKAVLRKGDKRPAKVDYKVDGRGRVLLPGMIDSHVRLIETGFAALTLDLSGATSLAQAQAMIRAYAARHPDRPWIIGYGWDQDQWQLGRFPTAAELDAAIADRPVWLGRSDGHAGWANSAALSAAGVTKTSKDPAGGRIERDATGKPAGVLLDAARLLVDKVIPPPRPAERDLAFRTAQSAFLSRGITAVADMGTTIEDWQTYRRAGDNGELQLRIIAYAAGTEAMTLIAGPAPTRWLYEDRLRLAGVSFLMDGALGSRGALLKAPYADAPNDRGIARQNATALRNLMSRAAMDGFQIAVHATGDEANSEALSAISELSETYKGDRRWRIEHAKVVDQADLPRFGSLGVVASVQPLHQIADLRMAEARLGPERLTGAYAWKSLATGGAKLAFGSDSPVEHAGPFATMAAAMTREDRDGQPFGGWQPPERLDRITAFAAQTTGGAYAAFAEDRIGRIAPGLRADFLFVDIDPSLASPDELRNARVLETWIAGRKVYQAKEDAGKTDESTNEIR